MLNLINKRLRKRVWSALKPAIDKRIDEKVSEEISKLQHTVNQLRIENKLLRNGAFVPPRGRDDVGVDAPFLKYSNCQSLDFYHPRYRELCSLIHQTPTLHRKQWEWIFILHKLLEARILRPGSRGLVFGVGVEALPAVFVKMGAIITATDAPVDMEGAEAWKDTSQHGANIDALLCPYIIPDHEFRERVEYRPCDMNNIDKDLTGYDFNWSSCCFEHLGSIEAGLDFVVNAVEKTLKVGGVAIHTTEFNLSSDDVTVSEGSTVLFRRKDIEGLVTRLRERGHIVEDFILGSGDHLLDMHVDVPPYQEDIHLKLLLANYVCTSVGLVITRGR